MCFESSGGLLLVVIVPSGITLVNLLFVHSAFLVLQYSFNLLSPISLLAKIIDLSLLYKLALDSKAQIQKNTAYFPLQNAIWSGKYAIDWSKSMAQTSMQRALTRGAIW